MFQVLHDCQSSLAVQPCRLLDSVSESLQAAIFSYLNYRDHFKMFSVCSELKLVLRLPHSWMPTVKIDALPYESFGSSENGPVKRFIDVGCLKLTSLTITLGALRQEPDGISLLSKLTRLETLTWGPGCCDVVNDHLARTIAGGTPRFGSNLPGSLKSITFEDGSCPAQIRAIEALASTSNLRLEAVGTFVANLQSSAGLLKFAKSSVGCHLKDIDLDWSTVEVSQMDPLREYFSSLMRSLPMKRMWIPIEVASKMFDQGTTVSLDQLTLECDNVKDASTCKLICSHHGPMKADCISSGRSESKLVECNYHDWERCGMWFSRLPRALRPVAATLKSLTLLDARWLCLDVVLSLRLTELSLHGRQAISHFRRCTDMRKDQPECPLFYSLRRLTLVEGEASECVGFPLLSDMRDIVKCFPRLVSLTIDHDYAYERAQADVDEDDSIIKHVDRVKDMLLKFPHVTSLYVQRFT